ncbi:MAG: hypothetical protein CMC96_14110 [Flavobacteriales bacterium]|nr:hypothetical protein [Flavobacteriales bacterium]|tara:strand:+ start:3359 stop:3835 length:477 start_codon:yes stop_codon:yes gene_type:complete
MKNYLLSITFLFSCFTSYTQPQTLNGILLDAPKGFVKTGDYKWQQNDDIIMVMSLEGELPQEKHLGVLKSIQEQTKNTTFIKNESIHLSGKDYSCTYHLGDNGLILIAVLVVRDGFSYILLCGVNPTQYEGSEEELVDKALSRVQFLRTYMITKIVYG